MTDPGGLPLEAERLLDLYRTARTIAVVGASSDESKPSHRIPAYLQAEGFRIIPVNPRGGTVLGVAAAASLADIDEPIDIVNVFRPASEAPATARAAVEAGARVLWLQLGIVSVEAARIAERAGLTVVMDACLGAVHKKLRRRYGLGA